MNEEIKYISDDIFTKLTKKQKSEIPMYCLVEEVEINKLIIVPTNKKSSGYCMGDFFAYTNGKGWWRPMSYDCWQINTDIENPVVPRYTIVRGDFENGGITIFSFMDAKCKAYMSYGGQIILKKN